jgi:hypothetical protein
LAARGRGGGKQRDHEDMGGTAHEDVLLRSASW